MDNKAEIREDKPQNFLLVEGDDDAHVCYHLLKHHQLDEHITIVDKKGIERLLTSLKVEIKGSGPRRLGIVVDADDDAGPRWQSIQAKLKEAGYTSVPDKPNASGTILKEDQRPVIGVWLMPDNETSGMLEDFASSLISQTDLLWPIARNIVQKVIEIDCRFRETYKIKAELHTWLAWQEEPGKPVGQAITKRYLDANALHAQQLIGWLRKLFDLETI